MTSNFIETLFNEENSCLLPFAYLADFFWNNGFSVIPIDKDNKFSSVRWKYHQNNKPSVKCQNNWINSFGSGNIALITGKFNNITVVDCDNPYISSQELELIFGESNYIVKTPRGGHHLYYLYSGETCSTNYSIEGVDVDIRGEGGYAIIPPSKTEKGNYSLVRGNVDDLRNLTKPIIDLTKNIGFLFSDSIVKGERNNKLFSIALLVAKDYEDFQKFEQEIFDINEKECELPLKRKEVYAICRSVWSYKEKGTLYSSSGRSSQITEIEMEKLGGSKAVALLANIRKDNQGLRDEFNIPQEYYAKKLRVSQKTISKLIKILLDEEIIFLTKENKFKELKRYSFLKSRVRCY